MIGASVMSALALAAAGPTDLRLAATTAAGAEGLLRTTVVVHNAGPRTAKLPVLELRRPTGTTATWEGGCTPLQGYDRKDRCQLPALPRGASRTLVLVSEAPGGQVEVVAEAPDTARVDNAVTVTGSRAAELTPDGPATLMNQWIGGHTAEGPMPQVLMAVRVQVGAGGRAGTVRLRAGVRREPSVVGEPFTLPAEPGTYTFPAPRVHGDYREVRLGLDQFSGGHAIATCFPERRFGGDPCSNNLLTVFAGNPPPGEAGTPASSGGKWLALTPVYEYDSDADLLGDETEDRTDLQLRVRSNVDRRGRLRSTLTVTNAGRLPATLPILRAKDAELRWGAGCLPVEFAPGRRDKALCRLRSIRPGASRTVTSRSRPGAVTVEVTGQGVDLDPTDNTRRLG